MIYPGSLLVARSVVVGLVLLLNSPILYATDQSPVGVAPQRYAVIFNKGYGSDHLPKDPVAYERLLQGLKVAGFNTVLGTYSPERAELLKKHDFQIFVDLVASEHHVYKDVAGCQKLVESLRNNPVVYGYHLWSDQIGKTYDGRSRDALNVRTWDPTHPNFVGSYKLQGIGRVQNLDIFGYYDFHWERGGLWGHLNQAFAIVKDRRIPFLEYAAASPGRVGAGNANRIAFTAAMKTVFGMRGYTFHYTGGVINDAGELDQLGKDQAAANRKILSSADALMKNGLPTAVYATPATRTENDKPLEPVAVPGGLPAIPANAWFQITAGEVAVATCHDSENRDVLCLASLNAYQPQIVTLKFNGTEHVERFDRTQQTWQALLSKNGTAQLQVEDGTVELLRTKRKTP